jgi:pilus assembly protein CpaF
MTLIQEEICVLGREQYLTIPKRLELQKNIFHSLRKLDVLEDLLADETITEIMINGPDTIFIEREGRLIKTDLAFSSKEKLEDVIQKIVSANNKMVNESHPIVDTKLEDGTRINIVLPPVAVDHSILSIRKFPKKQITMETLLRWQSISEELVDFIRKLVIAGYNIFVSGGTGSGKTTFLNAMAQYIPGDERIVTIEDSAELQLLDVENLVRLEAREATMEGKLQVTIRDLVRASLRMRPDRIIVGECRGQEAVEMLQAFNTGHDGSFSTGHANSAEDMLARLETMALTAGEIPITAIRSQIASGVDIIVHLGRLRDRTRKVLQIVEILGMQQGEIQIQTLYEFVEDGKEAKVQGHWEKRNELRHKDKMIRAGIL